MEGLEIGEQWELLIFSPSYAAIAQSQPSAYTSPHTSASQGQQKNKQQQAKADSTPKSKGKGK